MKNEEILDPSEWPVTTEAVVADIIASLSPENKNLVRNTPREALVKFHFSQGMGIRNHYGLWHGNSRLIEAVCGGPCHPDDASIIIIEKVWDALQQQE